MKKILALIIALAMLLSLAACGGKTEPAPTAPNEPQQTEENNTEEQQSEPAELESIEGDPVEYGREYWEEKYPGKNICPFDIEENGTLYSYYWISGMNGYDGTIESWLNQPFNWNGWHKTADGCIVNNDETLKITDDWASGDEGLSSSCTVTTEIYVPGESTGNSDTSGNSNVEYAFNPPEDNFYVEYTTYSSDASYSNIVSKKDNVYTAAAEEYEAQVKYDFNEEKAYVDDWAGSQGWTEDGETFAEAESYEELNVYEFFLFEASFKAYFDAYGLPEEKLAEYCVGIDNVAGYGCWIFQDKAGSLADPDQQFWINVENGICMKATDDDGNVSYEVTNLDLNY